MLKYAFLFIIIFIAANTAFCKTVDTAVMYFGKNGFTVHSFAQAEYYMLITPPDPGDTCYNIQEFYKSGTLKFKGKADGQENVLKTGSVLLEGDCTSYFQNGKKSAASHYKRGYKDGKEEMYYPNGGLYCRKKYAIISTGINGETFYFDCYDIKGNKICDAGNGTWQVYDDSCKYIKEEGTIKKGDKEGDWKRMFPFIDTIKFIYHYKHSLIEKSEGYDKNGKAYPFKQEQDFAMYKSIKGMYGFAEDMYSRLNSSNKIYQLAISDSTKLSFIVEKNGSLSHVNIIGDTDDQSTKMIVDALGKCASWDPCKLYGIPYRTEFVIPMRMIVDYKHIFPDDVIRYRGQILKDD